MDIGPCSFLCSVCLEIQPLEGFHQLAHAPIQLHDHIAKEILNESPRDTNYYGREDVGQFLYDIMQPGASADWRQLLLEKTGSELSAQPMLNYFAPLYEWLKEENKGRRHTLPAL